MESGEASHLSELQTLLSAFRLERIVHLTLAAASFVLQVGFLAWLVASDTVKKEDMPLVYGMIAGPSGVLIVTMGRVLKMWSDCLRFLHPSTEVKNQ